MPARAIRSNPNNPCTRTIGAFSLGITIEIDSRNHKKSRISSFLHPVSSFKRSLMARAEAGKTRVGWIGTGVMGRWMCQHLMTKGYKATVHNRSKDKARPLLEAGASWADCPRQVAENADAIFAIVGFPKDVREVFLGEQGALAGCNQGAVLIDMTTSEPSLSRPIY